MKNLVLILLAVLLVVHLYAQDDGGHEEGSRTKNKNALTVHLRGASVVIENQTFDYRVLKYYSEETLRTMDAAKRKQIYFIYNQSYSVLDLNNCTTILPIDIDVSQMESYRLENQRAIIEYGNDCIVHVELLSRKEVDAQLALIKKL